MPAAAPSKPSRYETRIYLQALGLALPALALAIYGLFVWPWPPPLRWFLGVILTGTWLIGAGMLRERVARPLQTLSNLLAGLREGDYSVRGRGARHDDAWGEVMYEFNALSHRLREQRIGALEAGVLLRQVMAEIDIAIFAFDARDRLQLMNPAGERLLQRGEEALNRRAQELGLAACLAGEANRTLELALPGGAGRWELRRGRFRQSAEPYQLLLLTNLSRALREEERRAWLRLLRVLGHELNNSLAPIQSLAASLGELLRREPLPADWREDAQASLEVVASRSAALARFVEAYTRLARLPPPQLAPLPVRSWITRVARLETRLAIEIVAGPELTLAADADQLDLLLINLLRNGVDAALETGGGVRVRWGRAGQALWLEIEDDGPGLANPANLFVPFFTTKPNGSGIGLILSRQIAEAHQGALSLRNREDHPGCLARLHLPLA